MGRRASGSGTVEHGDVTGLHAAENRQRLRRRRKNSLRRMNSLRRPAGCHLSPRRGSKGDLQRVAAADLLLAQRGILLQQSVSGGVEMLRLYLFLPRGSEQDVEIVAGHLQRFEQRRSGLRGNGLRDNGLRRTGLSGNGLRRVPL